MLCMSEIINWNWNWQIVFENDSHILQILKVATDESLNYGRNLPQNYSPLQ